MIKAVIFDWDLTLAKTLRFRAKLMRKFCKLSGVSFISLALNTRHLFGLTVFDILKFVPKWMSRKQLLSMYKTLFQKHASMMKFTGRNALESLKQYKLGVVTNDLSENISWYLKQQGFSIPVMDTNLAPKPNPFALKKMLRKLKVKPSEAVYVGDHPVDIQMGKSAGVRTIALRTWLHGRRRLGKEKPDAVISSLKDIESIIQVM